MSSPVETFSDLSGPRQEYGEVNSNIRHYSGLRFQTLTVFFAATGGLAALAFGVFTAPGYMAEFLKVSSRIGGFLLTGLFFQYECLIIEALTKNRTRGKELETTLGYKQLSARSNAGLKFSCVTLRILFLIFAVFWLVVIIVFWRQ